VVVVAEVGATVVVAVWVTVVVAPDAQAGSKRAITRITIKMGMINFCTFILLFFFALILVRNKLKLICHRGKRDINRPVPKVCL
jgi:hypothetical protein